MAGRVPCRPALLRTCSAASGSRCGSSSGTVNWIFRGLLSGSMAGRWPLARAAAGTAAGLGAGAGALPLRSAPLRSGPAPARRAQLRLPAPRSQLAASGTLQPPIGSAPPPTAPSLPPAPSLNPVVAAPLAAGVPAPRAGERGVAGASPGGQPRRVCRCPRSSGQGGARVASSRRELLPARQVFGLGSWRGPAKEEAANAKDFISFRRERGLSPKKRRKGDLGMQQEGLRIDVERDFPLREETPGRRWKLGAEVWVWAQVLCSLGGREGA